MADDTVAKRATDAIRQQIDRAGIADILQDFRAKGGRAYLCAGAVRDALAEALIQKDTYQPRDLDIAVDGISKGTLGDILRDYGAVTNRHGGFTLPTPCLPVDFWLLSEAHGILVHRATPDITTMLRSFVLNANAVALELDTRTLIDLGSRAALESGHLDFVQHPLLHCEPTFAAKALLLSLRSNFRPSRRLRTFLLEHLNEDVLHYETSKATLPLATALALWKRYQTEAAVHEGYRRPYDAPRYGPNPI